MRILVVGDKGFIGRNLTPRLLREGHEVVGTEDFFNFQFESILTMSHSWDVIIHLGANIVNVDERMKLGMSAYDDILLDRAVCKYVEKRPPAKAFIMMSSCAVDYPGDPYCIIKRTLEAFGQTLYKVGVPTVILRPFSGYGPDQSEEYPFRAIFERALRREDPLTVWGGHQVRDWLFIDDLCDAIISAFDFCPNSIPYEIGTGEGTSLHELAQKIASAVGYSPAIYCDASKASSSPKRISDGCIVTEACTGWRSTLSLDGGIQKAVEFYKVQGRL